VVQKRGAIEEKKRGATRLGIPREHKGLGDSSGLWISEGSRTRGTNRYASDATKVASTLKDARGVPERSGEQISRPL